MRNTKAYTLVEMLISLVLGAILVLSMGAISSISNNSYRKVMAQAQVFNDIHYGIKFLQSHVRKASALYTETGNGSWVSQKLIVDHEAFGLFQNGAQVDFVYLPDKDDENQREIIFSVSSPGNVTLDFYKPPAVVGGAWPDVVVGDELEAIKAQLQGHKDRIPFDAATIIMRRI